MYYQVKTDKVIRWGSDGHYVAPCVTLKHESTEERIQIVLEDNCYVILVSQKDDSYMPTAWISPGIFEVLRKLPSPDRARQDKEIRHTCFK